MIAVQEKKSSYLSMFERFNRERADAEPTWLRDLRASAFDRFTAMGFPTTSHEEWRFTNVAPIAATTFEFADDAQLTRRHLAPLLFDGGSLLVFVNGRYAPDLSSGDSLPRGVKVTSLAQAIAGEDPLLRTHLADHADHREQAFAALNTAFMEDGALVRISRGMVAAAPIHLLHVSIAGDRPTICHPRHLIVAEENSQATIVESYVGLGEGTYFTNAVTEIIAGQNAILDHYKVERESDAAFHVATRQVHQFRDSNVSSYTASFGGGLVRNDINAVLDGEGCHCTLNGLYVLDGSRHVDNHLRVDHAKPHCNSWEFFKGVLSDASRAVFTGRIVVHKDAQKTDAKQSNMNLLLSKDAQVDTKPQLEIFADDVKCTHGATIGQVDKEAIFYLCTRGISRQAARSLLIYAFAGESIGQIRVESLRDQLQDLLSARLPCGDLLRIGRPYEYNREYAEHVRSTDRRRET